VAALTLQEDAERLLKAYNVAALAALETMLRASLAGHRTMGAAAYGLLPVDVELHLLDLAQKAVRAQREHGSKSQQAKAIGSQAMQLIKSALPGASHSRARKIWGEAINKVS
jgi:hypothetical protein